MPIIIDTCCLASVFKKTDSKHSEYIPVLDWIYKGNGRIIYGGTKYFTELSRCFQILRIINELKRTPGKVVVLDTSAVDNEVNRIKEIIPAKKFNDPQLAAISTIGNCMLICTRDTKSLKYLKNPIIYPHGTEPPKFYISEENAGLLCDENIHSSYK